MSALKKLLVTLLVLGGVIAAIPLLIPYDHFSADIEQTLKRRLGIETHIGHIRFVYAPRPHLLLEQVSFGKNGEGSVGKVLVPATLPNLLRLQNRLSNVSLEDVQLQQDFAVSLPGRLKPAAGEHDIQFASMRLENVNVALHQGAVGPMSGVVELNPDGTFKEVTVNDKDDHAELNIKPLNDKFSLEMTARNWVLPGAYEVRFDQLVMRGVADHNGVAIDYINGLVFGAAAVGQAQLSWQDGWKLDGTLETKGMQAEPLISLFSETTRATGRMAANARFHYEGDGYASLFKQPHIGLQFTLSDGELHNFDLVAPLKSQSPSTLRRGGQTRFDTLSGTAVFDRASLTLNKLLLNGGKFSASGAMAMGPDLRLSGHLNARLSAGALVVSAPLVVEGQLDSPEIHSSGAFKPGGDEATTQVF
jgi:hypothetical protein